jgi:hypothetical protein
VTIPSPCAVKGNVDLTRRPLQDLLDRAMISLELLNRQCVHSLRRNVRTRNLDRRIEVFENLLQSRVFNLLERLLAFDYPVDNELLELSSIEAFDQAIGQRLLLWIGTFEVHEVRNRSKNPLASFLL